MITRIVILLLLSCNTFIVYSIDPFGALFGGGAILYEYGKSVVCKIKECCTDDWTKHNLTGIEKAFKHRLVAQHLVERIIPRTIKAHLEKEEPKKALVLSFHGWVGSGKNYVADMIANHVYKKGINSAYVHRFIAEIDFPHRNEVEIYKDDLRDRIMKNTKECGRSMFIFDEIEKIAPGVANVLKPFLDHHQNVKNIDYRKNIFIFLSNTVGERINKETLLHFNSGLSRESITSKQMEKILSVGSLNSQGGLKDSNFIHAGLVDFFVPFLPMERDHVKQCIRAEIHQRNETVKESIVSNVADELEYFPKDTKVFSTTGCKKVAKKLDGFL